MYVPNVGTVTFIGSHLDVVPANPETWERNPFKLIVEVQNPMNTISDGSITEE